MKKQLTTLFSLAATLFAALTLTACGEEVRIEEPSAKEGTVFSAGASGTRTTIDDNALFYWEEGDKIYVDEDGSGTFALASDEIEMDADRRRANFYFRGKTLSNPTYNLIYKGSSPESGATVKIAAAQEQSDWNNCDHLSAAGDCATATATKQANGSYTFDLEHKAHYLIFKPYKDAGVSDDWKLVSIEITDADGATLCGTYPITLAGLGANTGTGAGSTVTLSLAEAKSLPAAASGSLYAVIEPCTAAQGGRNLKVKYNIQTTTSSFSATKELSRTFAPNGVTLVSHSIADDSGSQPTDYTGPYTFENTFYTWDARQWYWYGVSNYPTENGRSATGYPISTDSNRWYNTAPTDLIQNNQNRSVALYSAANMPCFNALTWYLSGGVYWDSTTEWIINGETKTGGIWLKKWKYISGKPVGSTILSCAAASGTSSVTPTTGKPTDNVIDQYFFLPALGGYTNGILNVQGTYGYFWSSSCNGAQAGVNLYFKGESPLTVNISGASRDTGFVGGSRPDGTAWFQ